MAKYTEKTKKPIVLGGTGNWVFKKTMSESLEHMGSVLNEVKVNTAKARASQPKRRVA